MMQSDRDSVIVSDIGNLAFMIKDNILYQRHEKQICLYYGDFNQPVIIKKYPKETSFMSNKSKSSLFVIRITDN